MTRNVRFVLLNYFLFSVASQVEIV